MAKRQLRQIARIPVADVSIGSKIKSDGAEITKAQLWCRGSRLMEAGAARLAQISLAKRTMWAGAAMRAMRATCSRSKSPIAIGDPASW
jgi:hypothetical protein